MPPMTQMPHSKIPRNTLGPSGNVLMSDSNPMLKGHNGKYR